MELQMLRSTLWRTDGPGTVSIDHLRCAARRALHQRTNYSIDDAGRWHYKGFHVTEPNSTGRQLGYAVFSVTLTPVEAAMCKAKASAIFNGRIDPIITDVDFAKLVRGEIPAGGFTTQYGHWTEETFLKQRHRPGQPTAAAAPGT
jgi:hypothetical protein